MGGESVWASDSVCVLCGEPWVPQVKNRCACGGFCSWGPEKGADPDSWIVTDKGWTPRPVPWSVRGDTNGG